MGGSYKLKRLKLILGFVVVVLVIVATVVVSFVNPTLVQDFMKFGAGIVGGYAIDSVRKSKVKISS